jgi:hypothetical protein
MKTRVIIRTVLLIVALAVPCYAIRSMMFNSIDQYVERAAGIWIVKILGQNVEGQEVRGLPVFEAKILRNLKGETQKEPFLLFAVSRQLIIGRRYLVFGFNKTSGGAWLDNGNVSPVEIPPSLSLTEMEGESLKNQILSIMTARCTEIEKTIKRLNDEKKVLEEGLLIRKRLPRLP